MEGNASPRKPNERRLYRSDASRILDVACRSNASRASVSTHSAAVIDHLNQRPSALAVIHRDGRTSGIDGIFHQLLDDRSGTAHHLARGDLVGDPVGQHSDPVVLHLFSPIVSGTDRRTPLSANGRSSACGRICSYRGSVRPSGNARSRRAVPATCVRRHSPTRARGY